MDDVWNNPSMGLVLGYVVDTHPEHNSLDIVLFKDGRQLANVPMAGISMSGESGAIDLPPIERKDGKTNWDRDPLDGDINMMALVGFLETGQAICMGFMSPPTCQMNTTEENRRMRMSRHWSDVYSVTDKDGNTEWKHPSGTVVRIAEEPETDIAIHAYDKNWNIKRNLDRAVGILIKVDSDGQKIKILLKKDGDIEVEAEGKITVKAKGEIKVESEEKITLKAPTITLDGDVNVTGTLTHGGPPCCCC